MAGLYFHIPFCTHKCLYCDFYSGNQLYLIDDYVDSLVREIRLRYRYLDNEVIETIYFGGGTPSLLTARQLSTIINSIFSIFKVDHNCEITLECNPENITKEYVKELFNLGINRISLGVQFLNNEILKKFNRNHSKDQIFNSLEILSNSDFHNLSIDLIYCVPGISNDFLLASLNQLLSFDIRHVSAYCLTIAKNSQLYWKIEKGEFVESDESVFLSQYTLINDCLKSHDFKQYEISNYAKDGFYSKHNLGYWDQKPYLGIGVAAHSYNLISRQWNHNNIKKYIRDLSEVDATVDFKHEILSDIQLYNEYIILKMRTLNGISLKYVEKMFGVEIFDKFRNSLKILMEKNYFVLENDLVIPKQSDLLIADYLSKFLMI
jgi:oxygen-independent coproporphyrinogen-3 oxidase